MHPEPLRAPPQPSRDWPPVPRLILSLFEPRRRGPRTEEHGGASDARSAQAVHFGATKATGHHSLHPRHRLVPPHHDRSARDPQAPVPPKRGPPTDKPPCGPTAGERGSPCRWVDQDVPGTHFGAEAGGATVCPRRLLESGGAAGITQGLFCGLCSLPPFDTAKYPLGQCVPLNADQNPVAPWHTSCRKALRKDDEPTSVPLKRSAGPRDRNTRWSRRRARCSMSGKC